MKFLILKTKNPYVNLAIEEYLFSETADDIFMLWQNEPTVVIGKHQNVYAEINSEYISEHNIHIARRITGGGAVYHDLGNLNYTFISTREKGSGIDFEYFTAPIIEAIKKLGIEAKLSGRNDLMIDDKKFSGNAQHAVGCRVLHHGTLLFDSNLEILSRVLNVDEEKLKSKAIKSARSRVINLKSIINCNVDINEFINVISQFVIEKYNPEIINAPTSEKIDELIKRNSSKEWLYPNRAYISNYEINKKARYPFGIFETHLNMSNDIINDIKIFGDFFGKRDISELEAMLISKSIKCIEEELTKINIDDYIHGMTNEIFISHIK